LAGADKRQVAKHALEYRGLLLRHQLGIRDGIRRDASDYLSPALGPAHPSSGVRKFAVLKIDEPPHVAERRQHEDRQAQEASAVQSVERSAVQARELLLVERMEAGEVIFLFIAELHVGGDLFD